MYTPKRLVSSFFHQEMENTRPQQEDMDGNLINFTLSQQFFLDDFQFHHFYLLFTLKWAVNEQNSRQGKDMNKRSKKTGTEKKCTILENVPCYMRVSNSCHSKKPKFIILHNRLLVSQMSPWRNKIEELE